MQCKRKVGLTRVNVATHALRGDRSTNATFKMAGANDRNLRLGMPLSRHVIFFKIVPALVYQTLKLLSECCFGAFCAKAHAQIRTLTWVEPRLAAFILHSF